MQIFLIIVASVLLSGCILFALLVYKTSVHAVNSLESAHERTTKYTQDLLDRIMSGDFAEYKAQVMAEKINEAVDEELLEPELEPIPLHRHPDRGGFGSRLGLRALSVRPSEESE